MDSFILTKLDLSGPIDENTPLVVLREIADAHDVPLYNEKMFGMPFVVSELIKQIDLIRHKFVFHNSLRDSEVPNIIVVINKFMVWNTPSLTRAYDFILKFHKNPYLHDGRIFYGEASPIRPISYSPCMLYRLLKLRNLNINIHASVRQMVNAVTIAYREPSTTRSILYSEMIVQMDSDQLSDIYLRGIDSINLRRQRNEEIPDTRNLRRRIDDSEEIYDNEDGEIEDEEIDGEMEDDDTLIPLQYLMENVDNQTELLHSPEDTANIFFKEIEYGVSFFDDDDYLLERVIPVSRAEAVILCALRYEIDISSAKNPMEEYKILQKDPDVYEPQDETLKKMYDLNPLRNRLNYFFNPCLPPNIYSPATLKRLALAEGYIESDFRRENHYSLLQTAYFSDTFYHGKHQFITNTKTFSDLEDIENMKHNEIVCYGSITEKLFAFTYKELSAYFMSVKNFKDPSSGYLFRDLAIQKLKKICDTVYPNDTMEYIKDRVNLKDIISTVELMTSQKTLAVSVLYNEYNSSSAEIKMGIESCLIALLNLGFYMRAWDGVSPLPVTEAPVLNYDLMDDRIYGGIHIFEREIDKLDNLTDKKLGKVILELPLMLYTKGDYLLSISEDEGITVGERLDIVKGGSLDDNTNSCVRLSSNWLCSTSYKIMKMIGLELPFDIVNLRYIT